VFSNEDAAIQSMNNLNAEYGLEDEEHYYTTELIYLWDKVPEHWQYN